MGCLSHALTFSGTDTTYMTHIALYVSCTYAEKLPVAVGDRTSLDVTESPQHACLPGGAAAAIPSALQSTLTPPTRNMADPVTVISTALSVLPQQPVTFIGGIPIVQTSFPAGMGRTQQSSPLIAGSSPGFYMLPPQVSVTSHSLEQLSNKVQKERSVLGFTGEEDVPAGSECGPTHIHAHHSHPYSLTNRCQHFQHARVYIRMYVHSN